MFTCVWGKYRNYGKHTRPGLSHAANINDIGVQLWRKLPIRPFLTTAFCHCVDMSILQVINSWRHLEAPGRL